MANRINIGFGTIFKRSSCLNSVSESKAIDAGKRFNNLNLQLDASSDGRSVSPSIKNSLRSFIESISNLDNANKYFHQPMYLVQEFNKSDIGLAQYTLREYVSEVLPYVEDLSGMKESVERYELTDDQKRTIIEAASRYMIADRVLNNHEKISKRFNISEEVDKVKSRGLKFVVESCCSMIDTYSINPYAKFNLCLEEMGYLFDKKGINYDKEKFVEYTTEYFLLRSPKLSSRDIKGFQTVLSENCYLSEKELSLVEFVTNPPDSYDNDLSITKEIQKFLMTQEKTMQSLEDTIKNCLRSSTDNLRSSIGKVIWLIWDVYRSEMFNKEEMDNSIPIWFDLIVRRLDCIESDEGSLLSSKGNINQIIDSLEEFKGLLIVTGDDDSEYYTMVCVFKRMIDKLISKLKCLSEVSYSEDNIQAIAAVNCECTEPMALNEFKIFKFHNLVRASMNLDKFLKYKARNIYTKGSRKTRKIVRKINDVLFGESANIYSYIGEDAKVDICVAQYSIDESCVNETQKFLEEVCKEFNNRLLCENCESIKCYYLINPSVAEIHLKESASIKTEEIDWKAISENDNGDFDIYIEDGANVMACIEALGMFSEAELNIEERLNNFFDNPNLTMEHFEIAMEALSLLDIQKEQVKVFSEKFSNYRYNTAVLESVITESQYQKESTRINSLSDQWIQEQDVPIEIQVEAFQILSAVLEAAPPVKKPKVGPNNQKKVPNPDGEAKDNPNTKVDETRKNPFAGINLNSMKLYLTGLKTKMKDMSTKEKEVSRNLDNNFRLLVKSMKNALVSDRREAIIKGSVIPSFSRCIKIAIGLAGMGLITGNPLVPLLAAIGGMAVSKRLTQKERILLLDEIDTELQVVEKEISNAESKNQMKKYRALLKYKKDLQRQYQRIRYNIRVGKDILPGSAAGMSRSDD